MAGDSVFMSKVFVRQECRTSYITKRNLKKNLFGLFPIILNLFFGSFMQKKTLKCRHAMAAYLTAFRKVDTVIERAG